MPDVQEKFLSFIGGQNQSVHPSFVQVGEYASGVNLSSRTGLAHTRPKFVEHPSSASLSAGKFQGAGVYHLSGQDRLVYGIAGKIYTLKLEDDSITDHGLVFDPTAMDRFYFCQADRYMVVQDGDASTSHALANWPLILDNLATVDQSALADHQRLPKGAAMAYGHGRLFVAVDYVYSPSTATPPNAVSVNVGRVGFVAGDIIKAHSPEDVIQFTSEEYLNEGGRIPLSTEAGKITAMAFQKNVPSGTGEGPLIVSAEHGMSAFQVNALREEWNKIDLGQVLFLERGLGASSANSFVNLNADIIYRSFDGIRMMSTTVADAQASGYSNRTVSGEVRTFLESDDNNSLLLSSAAIAGHRLLMTCEPDTPNKTFKGLISLDLEPVSSIKGNTNPLYDGVWTGLHVQQVLSAAYNGKQTHFIFALDESGGNRLFYIVDNQDDDEGSNRPPVRIYTGQKFFKDPWRMKFLRYAEFWFDDIQGQVDIQAYYKPDGYPFWCPMKSGTIHSDLTGSPRRENKIRLSVDEKETDSLLETSLNRGYGFEFCFQWTGHARMTKSTVVANMMESGDAHQAIETIDVSSQKLVLTGSQTTLDDFEYRIV
jgi:hypothetical protein